MDNVMTFAIWSLSVVVFIVLFVFFCFDRTRILITEYDDGEPADAAVLRSDQHEERVAEWMQRLRTVMMERQDGFVFDKDKASNGDGGGEKSSSEDEAATECVICLEELEDGDMCKALPQCNHVFHKECLVSWMIQSNACPICRALPAVSVSNLPV